MVALFFVGSTAFDFIYSSCHIYVPHNAHGCEGPLLNPNRYVMMTIIYLYINIYIDIYIYCRIGYF